MSFAAKVDVRKEPSAPPEGKVRGLVVSDLHLGAPYSDMREAEYMLERGTRYPMEFERVLREQLENKEDPAKFCVLLGDIYEYINHRDKKDDKAMKIVVEQQMDHLYKLVTEHPGCKFIYVIGNHERIPMFDKAIDGLLARLERENARRTADKNPLEPAFKGLEIQRHFRKIGDGLFMHGDQAMSPHKYHVSLTEPDNYSNIDRRYDESHVEINRNKHLQLAHDGLNVLLPWSVGRTLHRPSQCAVSVFKWCHWYDEQQMPAKDRPPRIAEEVGSGAFPELKEKAVFLKNTFLGPDIVTRKEDYKKPPGDNSLSLRAKPEPGSHILDGIHHIFMGHTHDPFTAKTFLDPETGKDYNFYNTGASIFRIGLTRRINRHCFNALNVYLDSDEIDNPNNHIAYVNSVKWPQHHWPKEQEAAVAR